MQSKYIHTAKAILFIMIFLIILSGISQILSPKDNTKNQWKHDYIAYGVLGEPENTVDVLLLGDSELYSSIVPLQLWEKYGYTSFSCSSKGQHLWYTTQFLLDTFKHQSPKIVILETDMIFRYFTMDNALLHSTEILFPALKYHDRWKNISFNDVIAPVDYTYLHSGKGYIYSDKIAPAKTGKYMKPSNNYAEITPANETYVKMIQSFCSNHGAKLVLMSTPSTKNWNMSKHNSIERFAEEIGVDFIDMNTLRSEIPIDWKHDTRDKGDHLNIFGAIKATSYLGMYLEETELLSSHKDDPAYNSWNEALDTFLRDNDLELSIFDSR